MSLVSGYEFHKLAKWSYCPYYQVNFKPELIQENDIVFLNLDYFIQFISLLSHKPPKHKFILIIHNSLLSFTLEHFKYLYNITNHIFSINSLVINKQITPIPIGFIHNRNLQNIFQENFNEKINKDKDILIYSNFSLTKNKIKRIECLNAFINKNWVYKDQQIPIEEFYKKIRRSKYILSPEGNKLDSHRIYESIFFNTIPIMKKNKLYYFYKILPIIIVDNWTDVTKEFLESNYDTFYNKLTEWKNNNDDWFTAIYWLNQTYIL
jgi:hypothetical protein